MLLTQCFLIVLLPVITRALETQALATSPLLSCYLGHTINPWVWFTQLMPYCTKRSSQEAGEAGDAAAAVSRPNHKEGNWWASTRLTEGIVKRGSILFICSVSNWTPRKTFCQLRESLEECSFSSEGKFPFKKKMSTFDLHYLLPRWIKTVHLCKDTVKTVNTFPRGNAWSFGKRKEKNLTSTKHTVFLDSIYIQGSGLGTGV